MSGPGTSLNGIEKCAVLCMALGPQAAAKLLQQLQPDEAEEVSEAIARMPIVDPAVMRKVVEEWQSAAQGANAAPHGGLEYAERVLEGAFGAERSSAARKRLRENVRPAHLERLKAASPDTLANLLRREHPQAIAFVLAGLEPRQSLAVVRSLDPTLAGEVLVRIARMGQTSPEILALVELGLGTRTESQRTSGDGAGGGPSTVARLLNQAPAELGNSLLEEMRKVNDEVATQVQAQMFVFEDLLRLDRKAIQRLLRDVEGKELALALKAASDELKALIRANMTERGAEALSEEMELLGPVRIKDVEDAHARILATLKQLEAAGELVIPAAGGADDLV